MKRPFIPAASRFIIVLTPGYSPVAKRETLYEPILGREISHMVTVSKSD
jgi:hypothetical protein